MTRVEDIEAAEAAGADAIGLVLVAESPRAVSFDRARELAAVVTTKAVLLTKDLAPEDLIAAVLATGVDAVQPYGAHSAEAAEMAAEVGLFVLRPVDLEFDVSALPEAHVPLFDNRSPAQLGGTGQQFDHRLLPTIERPFVLAGGLGPDNVRQAIRTTGAWGVDASSRLESRPGVKDHDLVAEFVREAKQA
jgi:phosphoribosylanthranilate isomerase